MKKAFAAGIVLAGIEGIIGFILRDSMSFQSIFGTGAIIFIAISIITSGLAVGGMQQRANYHSETKEGRDARFKIALTFLGIAVPTIICYLIFFLI
ncbi:hypothetical protein C6370_08975 [Bacillus atrophaeus]|uniref:DUF5316 family protein n=1 Tax=Bacillus atrophaeus TaxID=1452 RepID=UPI000331120E|nr:DUF5316 family protein [Bacillus atrophaeus]AKL86705.1 YwkF [Bacillus atrophaeus UCMB-5137]MCY8858053.1 DUF5316 domain-containing protein [Bacillus atrophaeus]MDS9995786.1 DUF5316 domain-containing protein [Bacillus atrophaeus]PRS08759.1 hypothetical protein C6W22_11300 [Bacillus atrophaeus]PSA95120.1 hypothetical protein C6370_08975 [Bacillus atrophaeus]